MPIVPAVRPAASVASPARVRVAKLAWRFDRCRRSHGFSRPTAPVVREVVVGDNNIVADLAQKMAVKGSEVVKALFKMGVMATINQTIDHDTAVLVVEELGHTPVADNQNNAEDTLAAHTQSAELEGEKKSRVRRWSPSWATSITARPRCSTTSVAPRSPRAKPVALPSTSARTTWKRRRA